MIISVNGQLGSGKNELCRIISVEYPEYLFETKAFADKLKKIVSELANVPLEYLYSQKGKNMYIPEFDKTLGQMLQDIGTAMKSTDEDIWVKTLMREYTLKKNEYPNWLICDLRYKNELNACINRDAITVKIVGDPKNVRLNSNRDLNHSSEIDLNDYNNWDYIIDNNGSLDNLRKQAVSMMKDIIKKNKI